MNKVRIGNRDVGDGNPCLISVEPGATFTNFEEAKKMLKAAIEGGSDAVKFQTFIEGDSDRIMGKKDIKINFTTKSGKKQELVYDALRRRELSKNEWEELVCYAQNNKIVFITSAVFPETIEFLSKIGVDAIKVSKGDINNLLLIETIAETGLPVILDGRERFVDVEKAITICEEKNNKQIVVMHCPSGYPAENAGVHLNAIKEIRKRCDYPVGYADHSQGMMMNYAALALGVNMLEKTITPDKDRDQVEHYMSLLLGDIPEFVKNIRAVEDAMGDPTVLEISRVEESARRSLVAKVNITKGEKVTRDVLDFKRPGDAGISVSEGFSVMSKKARMDITEGTFLQWDMLE